VEKLERCGANGSAALATLPTLSAKAPDRYLAAFQLSLAPDHLGFY
jgi:hypothetical protein